MIRRAHAQLEAIGEVSLADAFLSGDVGEAARLVTETAARLSGCERVNVWLFNDDETELHCIDLYEATPRRHSAGLVLREAEYRAEFRAVKDAPYVAADDPLTDPRTAGYVHGYLRPLGITSMLDAVIRASGRHIGLLCLEHVGQPHHWEQDEIAFACQLADKIGLAVINRERRRADARLQESESRYRALVEATTDYIWEVDALGVFTYVSPRMADLIGCHEGERVRAALWAGLPGEAKRMEAVLGDWSTNPRPYSMVETAALARDGRRVVLETSSMPLFDATGALRGYRGISRDVTARVQAAEQLEYRDRVRQALATCLTELGTADSLDVSVPRALGHIGLAVQADRVRVCRLDEGQRSTHPAFGWTADGASTRVPDTACGEWAWDVQAWLSRPGEAPGLPLVVPPGVVVRMMVDGRLWGWLEVLDGQQPRAWTDTEIDSFRMIADMVGGVIGRETARTALARSEQTFRTVTEAAQDAIVMLDASGSICFWNRAAERTFGYTADQALGQHLHEWLAPARFGQKAPDGMQAFGRSGSGVILGQVVEMAATRRDGTEIPVELSVAPMELGSERFAVGILRDISERKRTEAEVLRLARFDTLTGLANRSLFVEAAERAMARAERGHNFAVLYLDLDRFKAVNDTLGHPVGDRLLQAVADRLRACGRRTDTIARIGGDEFAILQTDLQDPTGAGVLAGKIVAAMADPFTIDGNQIRTAASIGVTLYEPGAASVDTLLAHADVALYRAKSEGGGTFRFFTDAMDTDVRTRVTLGEQLRRAIAGHELFLEYQPQVDIDTGRIVGIEALVRWRHPQRGVLPPGAFISIAEDSGLIVALGEWVLRAACQQARQWMDEGLAAPLLAVNVSPVQFKAPLELERVILRALADSGWPAERLELELTETGLMGASRDQSELLRRLRERRIRLSIDEFGTGYSSLDYLQRFPVDRIKIAPCFVAELSSSRGNAAIVRAALGLARELGLGVIAEGVETSQDRDLLMRWGCRQGQGALFSAPLHPSDMAGMLRHGYVARGEARMARPEGSS